MARTLFTNIEELITNQGVALKRGIRIEEKDLGIIHNGALLWDSSHGILWMGKTGEIPKTASKNAKRVSLKGKILSPAFSDCHTHLVFAGSRHQEFALRLEGATYSEIAKAGGGIKSSVKATRAATEEELFKLGCERIESVLKLGVGLLEIKSGYGLDWPTERKMLRAISRMKKKFETQVLIQSTFLGAHDFPPEAKTEKARCGYVDKVADNILPQVAKQKLADACDVFFDKGYFNRAQTNRILTKASSLGLKIKLHADELADTGGAALAAELGALSADHLLCANSKGIQSMAKRGVVAVLLPSTAFYLGLPYAPIEKMRKAGVCIALATDFNPGSSPILHMPFILSLACLQMGMTMPEAFAAATYGGARALDAHGRNGFLRVGLKPKIAIFRCPSYQALISQVAHPGLCEKVL